VEKNQNEQWKLIHDFEIYWVSNYGELWVKECARILSDGRYYQTQSRYIKSNNLKSGYLAVRLCHPVTRERRHCLVHVLVAETFIGPAPTSAHQVNHKDGNKKNNKVNNLEWVTSSENRKHAINNGLCPTTRISDGKENLTITEWAAKLGIPRPTLYARYKAGNSSEAILNKEAARSVGAKRTSASRIRNSFKYKDDLTSDQWAAKLGISKSAFIWRVRYLTDETLIYKIGRVKRR